MIKGQGGLKSRGSKAFVAAEYTEQGYTDCLRPKPKTFNWVLQIFKVTSYNGLEAESMGFKPKVAWMSFFRDEQE